MAAPKLGWGRTTLLVSVITAIFGLVIGGFKVWHSFESSIQAINERAQKTEDIMRRFYDLERTVCEHVPETYWHEREVNEYTPGECLVKRKAHNGGS